MPRQNIDTARYDQNRRKAKAIQAKDADLTHHSQLPSYSVGHIPTAYLTDALGIKCKARRRKAVRNLKQHFAFQEYLLENGFTPTRYLTVKPTRYQLAACKTSDLTLASWMGKNVLRPLKRWLRRHNIPFIGQWVIELKGGPHINIGFWFPADRKLERALLIELATRFCPTYLTDHNQPGIKTLTMRETGTPVCLIPVTNRPSLRTGRVGYPGLVNYLGKEIARIAGRQPRRTSWNVGKVCGTLRARTSDIARCGQKYGPVRIETGVPLPKGLRRLARGAGGER